MCKSVLYKTTCLCSLLNSELLVLRWVTWLLFENRMNQFTVLMQPDNVQGLGVERRHMSASAQSNQFKNKSKGGVV